MQTMKLVACLLLPTLTAGCFHEEPPHKHPINVVFVLVDTLRADHTSVHGYERPTTPFLDELAAESVVFDRARSQAGCTYPSVNSIFTSRYAFEFYHRKDHSLGIPADLPTMAEVLKSQGYTTVAVSASPIVRATPSDRNPEGGFDAGFDVFDETCLWEPAACVTRRALELTEGLKEPYFLYLHYMDPHDHYQAPASFQKYAGEYDRFEFIAKGDPNPIGEMLYNEGPHVDIGKADIQHLVDLYDDEIAYFDDQFGEFLTALRSSGVLDRSILVVTADHGEEFLEHGHIKHCRGVWNTLTHVPLILRLPLREPARISRPTELVDLFPTILDVLDVHGSEKTMRGRSLIPLIDDRPIEQRFAFSDQSRYRSVDDGRFHLILDGGERTVTLYDTHADPLELRDLAANGHPEVERLAEELNLWLKRTGQWVRFDLSLAASLEQEERLRALGYLE